MPAPNSFDHILSTTLNSHRKKFTDNIFGARPLAFGLKKQDRIRWVGGGAQIIEPIIYSENDTAASYSEWESLDIEPTDEGMGSAIYPWKQFSVGLRVSGLEEAKNDGEEELIDLVATKVEIAEESAIAAMNRMFYLDGTGNSGKNFLGLAALVATTNTTVGSIDSATHAYWRPQRDTVAEALSIGKMNRVYNQSAVGNDKPSLELTTLDLYERYESLLQPQARYSNMEMADAGFENLMHKGAPLTYDGDCPAGFLYILNLKYLGIVAHKKKWAKPTPFVRPHNADFVAAQILFYGNFVVRNRARQGVLSAKTA
jgi:hypothetical protein